jgi:hypothetical protein
MRKRRMKFKTIVILVIAQLGVTTDFGLEPRQSKESHARESAQTALNGSSSHD